MSARIPRPWGVLAEFEDHETLLHAVRRARAAGYRRLEAYSPFPLPEVADALGIPTAWKVALITLVGGLVGAGGGYALQWYLMAVDYPLNIGGRPLHSWPAFVPVTFELMVLFASITVTVGLFLMNRLPRPHHPLFGVPAFARATQDRFFLSVEAADERFDPGATRSFLESVGARTVTDVHDE